MNNTQLTTLRTGATAAITALAAVFTLYPHFLWIPAVIAAASAVGIHAIPSVGQTILTGITAVKTAATTGKVTSMSENAAPEVNVTPSPVAPTSETDKVVDESAELAELLAPELTNPVGVQGAALMGVTPAPVTPAPVAPDAPGVPPVATPAPAVPAPAVTPPVAVSADTPPTADRSKVADLISTAIDALKAIAAEMQ